MSSEHHITGQRQSPCNQLLPAAEGVMRSRLCEFLRIAVHFSECMPLTCSRTSGSENIHAAVRQFLATYPNPSAVLDAPPDEVQCCQRAEDMNVLRFL